MDVEVITDAGRRRRWSLEEKEELLRAAFASGAVVKAVARRNGISTGLLYRWRAKLWKGRPAPGFARVVAIPGPALARPPCAECVEAEIGGNRVSIPPSTPPALAAAVIGALVKR